MTKNPGRDRASMVRLDCRTRVAGRIAWPINQDVYDLSTGLSAVEKYADKSSPVGQICNEREPKEEYIRQYNGTTGSPKGRKVLGDGVIIVAEQKSSPREPRVRRMHTTAVMCREREVSQYINLKANQCLSPGIEKLRELSQRSVNEKVNVWKLMLDPEMYIIAYNSIKGKDSAMTPGIGKETLDGFSMEKINKIIARLKDHTYQFSPIRRTYIPNKNGKVTPLGIPGPEDKVVQKVIAIILEAIYDNEQHPVFSNQSHGFRRGRSTHTALKYITQWTGTDWWIEGEIKSYFDNINYKILEGLLKKKIEDQQFIDLYWKAVRADYINLASGKREYGITGVPQGGTLSPILSNIYLHELDMFMAERIASQEGNGIPVSIDNPEYRKIHVLISNKRQTIKRTSNVEKAQTLLKEVKALEVERAKKPSKMTNPQTFQIWYVRYADDFGIGIRGTEAQAKGIYDEMKAWIEGMLKIEIKTEITNIRKDRANFLGAQIRAHTSRTHDAKKTTRIYQGHRRNVRVPSGKMIILAPIDKLVRKLEDQGICRVVNLDKRMIIPQRKTAWINLELSEIVKKYNQVWQGILNYYSFAWNRCQLNLIQYLLHHSAACTIMNKLKLHSRRAVFQKFGKTLQTKYKDDKGKEKMVEFKLSKTLVRISKYNTQPAAPFEAFYYNIRTKSRIEELCRICGSSEQVEMHHVKGLKDGKTSNTFKKIMSNLNRLQIPVCRICHKRIHRGEYDDIRLNKLTSWLTTSKK